MLEEEFSKEAESLALEALSDEEVALAKYWDATTSLKKLWEDDVVTYAKTSIISLSTVVVAISIFVYSPPLPSLLGELMRASGIIFGPIAGIVGVLTGAYSLDHLFKYKKEKRALPPVSENYPEEMGELASGYEKGITAQKRDIGYAQNLFSRRERFAIDRTQLQAYQLATVKDVYELSEPEGFELLEPDS